MPKRNKEGLTKREALLATRNARENKAAEKIKSGRVSAHSLKCLLQRAKAAVSPHAHRRLKGKLPKKARKTLARVVS